MTGAFSCGGLRACFSVCVSLARFNWANVLCLLNVQPTPLFVPGESHGQRSLVDYSPWGRKESDTTERLCFHKVSHR